MAADGVNGGAVAFTLTASDDSSNPYSFSLGPDDGPVKIGRYKKNHIIVNHPGASAVHLEIRPLASAVAEGRKAIVVRDVSSNGVGIKTTRHIRRVEKGIDVEVPTGSSLIVPFRVKAAEGQTAESLQTFLAVSIDGAELREDSPSPVAHPAPSPPCQREGVERVPVAPPSEANGRAAALAEKRLAPDASKSRSRSRRGESKSKRRRRDASSSEKGNSRNAAARQAANGKKKKGKDRKKSSSGSSKSGSARSRSGSSSRSKGGKQTTRVPEGVQSILEEMLSGSVEAAFDPEAVPEAPLAAGKRGQASAAGKLLDGASGNAPQEPDSTKRKKESRKSTFAPGQLVRVVALKAKAELNGKVGTVVEFDKAGGFWKVRMEDGTGKAFRPINLEAVDSGEASSKRAKKKGVGATGAAEEMLARCRNFALEKERERNEAGGDAPPGPPMEAPPAGAPPSSGLGGGREQPPPPPFFQFNQCSMGTAVASSPLTSAPWNVQNFRPALLNPGSMPQPVNVSMPMPGAPDLASLGMPAGFAGMQLPMPGSTAAGGAAPWRQGSPAPGLGLPQMPQIQAMGLGMPQMGMPQMPQVSLPMGLQMPGMPPLPMGMPMPPMMGVPGMPTALGGLPGMPQLQFGAPPLPVGLPFPSMPPQGGQVAHVPVVPLEGRSKSAGAPPPLP